MSKDVSKLNLVEHVKKNILKQYKIMCIGDKGKLPGNDFELLTQPYSLSVDMVSDDMKTCWNILSDNQKGEKKDKKSILTF